MSHAVTGPVRVIGTGLLGTSIGLGLTRAGFEVQLSDASPNNERLAHELRAGIPIAQTSAAPSLVVVCVPPDVTAVVIAEQLELWPEALVTDVASVKLQPLEQLRERGSDLSRYLGGHPMAGRETGGPLSARADLFIGRPWVITPHGGEREGAMETVRALAELLGSNTVTLDARAHDESVALISHTPQIVSSLLAARLVDDEHNAAALAGQGLRDVTRIAASDDNLWVQILAANGPRVAPILRALEQDISEVAAALEQLEADGSRLLVAERMRRGAEGVQRIPGKHGGRRQFATVTVLVEDRPGQLAKLFADIEHSNINLEDLRMDHSQGAEVGLVEVSVLPEARATLTEALEAQGWRIAQ